MSARVGAPQRTTHPADPQRSNTSRVPQVSTRARPPLERLQHGAGNRTVHRLLTAHVIQAQLPLAAGGPVSGETETHLQEMSRGGHPLPEAERAFFEPRFGTSFADVRLHTDGRADAAARAIGADAFTLGTSVAFRGGQYKPGTQPGRRLLAHELTHVIQQHASPSASTATRISRSASVTCTTGTHGAPADPTALIDAAELMGGLALVGASGDLSLLKMDIVLPGIGAGGGYAMPTTQRLTDYQNVWGLPPAVSGTTRFRDRLGGRNYPSQAEALYHEIDGLDARYSRLSDRLLGNAFRYRCIGGPTTIGSCTGHCTGRDATACFNTDLIMVCPNFWNFTMGQLGLLLIHEAAHRVFGVDHARNFRHANCYATYAATANGQVWTGGPACVP